MAVFDTSRSFYATSGIAGRIGHVIADTIGAVKTWNDARITRTQLWNLSDHELEDIGLCRGDIELVAYGR